MTKNLKTMDMNGDVKSLKKWSDKNKTAFTQNLIIKNGGNTENFKRINKLVPEICLGTHNSEKTRHTKWEKKIAREIESLMPFETKNPIHEIQLKKQNLSIETIISIIKRCHRFLINIHHDGQIQIIWRKPSLAQKILYTLVKKDKPISKEEIEESILEKITGSKLNYALKSEPKIKRISRNHYGLKKHEKTKEQTKIIWSKIKKIVETEKIHDPKTIALTLQDQSISKQDIKITLKNLKK